MKETLEKDERKLLLDLFHIYAPTNGEKPLSVFIAKFLEINKIDYTVDNYGNIYSMKYPGEPILCSHQDCVGDAKCGSLVNFIDFYRFGNEEILKGNGNIGADDKIGIFLILLYLTKVSPKVNFIFSTGEEKSVVTGIKTIVEEIKNSDAFKEAPYCIVLDRRGFGDIICEKNDYGSKDFDKALSDIGINYGYSSVKGGLSDTNTISGYMNACNLSVGYYNPHTKTEFVVISEMINTFNYVCDIIENLPRDIPFEEKKPAYPTTYGGYNGNNYNGSYCGGYHNNYGGYHDDYYNDYWNKNKKDDKKSNTQKYYYDNDYDEIM